MPITIRQRIAIPLLLAWVNDRGEPEMTLERARNGQTSTWPNPDTAHSGTLTPSQTHQAASGQYCREYQHVVVVGCESRQSCGPPAGSPTARISRPYASNEDEGGN